MFTRKIAMSTVSIVTALALAGGATFAFFSDTATSNGNTFSAGTFDLHLKDSDQGFADSVTASMVTPAGWAPGDVSGGFICFRNNGSVDIQQVLFALSSTNANDEGNDLDNHVYVDTIELGDVTANAESACATTGTVSSEGLTNFTTLFESRFGNNTPISSLLTQIDGTNKTQDDLLEGLENKIPQNGVMKMRVFWKFSDAAPSTNVAGKSLNLNIAFNATQNEEVTP
jgi:spore coat-associated protein N